jgi:hypothetical protein
MGDQRNCGAIRSGNGSALFVAQCCLLLVLCPNSKRFLYGIVLQLDNQIILHQSKQRHLFVFFPQIFVAQSLIPSRKRRKENAS